MERQGFRGYFTAGLVALLCCAASIAAASSMSITSCPSSVQAGSNGSFSFEVTVTNAPGAHPGDVSVNASGSGNISGLSVSPSHQQLNPGESYTFTVSGTLNGTSNGTVNVSLTFVNEAGEIIRTQFAALPRAIGKKVTILAP